MSLPKPKGATKPLSPCNYPKCSKKSKETYCSDHNHLSTSKFKNKKGKPDPFYQSKRWRQTTVAYRKAHPLCEECEEEGRVTPADVTDHIVDWKDGGARFDWDNLKALCHSHHNSKTARTNQ